MNDYDLRVLVEQSATLRHQDTIGIGTLALTATVLALVLHSIALPRPAAFALEYFQALRDALFPQLTMVIPIFTGLIATIGFVMKRHVATISERTDLIYREFIARNKLEGMSIVRLQESGDIVQNLSIVPAIVRWVGLGGVCLSFGVWLTVSVILPLLYRLLRG